ncbi:MAG: hypothetical protein Q8M98_01120 [Candidatus Cloacimonadaceae bacterium]|nr:hypothetical protein [Candidatus Cloacimonadaceae bacterium]
MRKISLIIILMLLCAIVLSAQSPRELDDFSYIIELYDLGEYAEVESEIDFFKRQYPDSAFRLYTDYIVANIALSRGEYRRSQTIYSALIKNKLHPDILGDVYLNYAISCYQTGELNRAIELLQHLSSILDHPYYNYHANVWRAKAYSAQGMYLSAEHEYTKALKQTPADKQLRFDHYRVLLKLDRDDPAQTMIAKVDSLERERYTLAWLEHLLYYQRYSDMDAYLGKNNINVSSATDPMRLLMLRKALAVKDMAMAENLLGMIKSDPEAKRYLRALFLMEKGKKDEADTIFRDLVRGAEPEIRFLSYLERLKISFGTNPQQAIAALEDYIASQTTQSWRGEQYLQLGVFYFDRQDYASAIRNLVKARNFELNPELLDRLEFLIPEAYYFLGEKRLARDNFNRYLNLYSRGRYREKALLRIGIIAFQDNDQKLASANLKQIVEMYPKSETVSSARFYLGEINFYASNYNLALTDYTLIENDPKLGTDARRRIVQCLFYLEDYSTALAKLGRIPKSEWNLELQLLLASVHFNQKNYQHALIEYTIAENMATTPQSKTEAQSYKAYTLYYLKRFNDASALFYDLSKLSASPDIYLYQAAKSAYQARNYKHALYLYDMLIDEYPDSPYFLKVLTEMAYSNYNLGLYEVAFADWLNILRRYTAVTSISVEDQNQLEDIFNGISISLSHLKDMQYVVDLIGMVETFNSEYIKFELQFILVKQYADTKQWRELLAEAEKIRQNYPTRRHNELELLMAESLIRLNQAARAESLVSDIDTETISTENLLRLGELALLTKDYEVAMEKYLQAFERQASPALWVDILDLSQKLDFNDFERTWQMGMQRNYAHSQARILRLNYLMYSKLDVEAENLANLILDTDNNQYNRAQAETAKGTIFYQRKDFVRAISSFRRIRLIFRDFPDILVNAHYYYIVSLIQNGALKEGQLVLWEVQIQFSDDQIISINKLLDDKR